MNPNVVNICNGKVLADARYGEVIALDVPGSAPLRKLDVAYAIVRPGAVSPPHYHKTIEEVYAIARGSAFVTINGISTRVVRGDVVRIPRFTVHSIEAGEDGCEFWVSTSPPYTDDDDHETDAVAVDGPARSVCRIGVVIGTHRRGSVSGKVARQLCALYGELQVAVDLIDLADMPDSVFGPTSYETRYDSTTPLAQRFISVAALHVVCPEYNGSFPAPLKHALDIVPYRECLDGKPIALVGVAAGDWGGLRAVEQLQQVFAYRSSHVYGRRVFIKNVDEAPFGENGHLTDPEIVERLRAQVAGFADFVRRLSE